MQVVEAGDGGELIVQVVVPPMDSCMRQTHSFCCYESRCSMYFSVTENVTIWKVLECAYLDEPRGMTFYGHTGGSYTWEIVQFMMSYVAHLIMVNVFEY